MFDAITANVAATLVILVTGGIVGALLGTLVFGKDYKRRIAALEARLSQPIVINNVISGGKSATELAGDVSEIRTLTQAEYDALAIKNETTLYLIAAER